MKISILILTILAVISLSGLISADENDFFDENQIWKQDWKGLESSRMKRIITIKFEVLFLNLNLNDFINNEMNFF
jgi:cytochrome b